MSNENGNSSSENTALQDNFPRRFKDAENSLKEQIVQLKDSNLPNSDRAKLTEQCSSGISHLSNEVRNATSSLPAYDQRAYSTAIKTLNEQLQNVRSTSAPKRRFAFKKTAPAGKSNEALSNEHQSLASDATEDRAPVLQPSQPGSEANPQLTRDTDHSLGIVNDDIEFTNYLAVLTISSLSHSLYNLDQEDLRSAVSVTAIQQSLVDLSVSKSTSLSFSTMTIQKVFGSLLICGRVLGAAHITNVEKSTIILWSQQIRMHECKDCVIYLRASSNPIIEDCHDIRFAPLPDSFDLSWSDLSDPPPPNLWDQVDDFKWLKATPSPNWRTLQTEDDRAVDSVDWKIVSGQDASRSNLEDRLRAAKLMG